MTDVSFLMTGNQDVYLSSNKYVVLSDRNKWFAILVQGQIGILCTNGEAALVICQMFGCAWLHFRETLQD